ncbi:MAG: tetratricopeptide repeat protein [Acidobacteriaceae bacterium]|nr:tetratricopeptide repeat protein [Acidobacteriaceae bacterium]
MTHGILLLFLAFQSVSSEGAQHMQAGVEAHRKKDFNAAIAEFRKATQTDPNLAEAFLDLGEEYMQVHDYGTAVAPLKRALELKPDLEDAHLQLGYALLSQGFVAEAIPHLERVHAVEALGIAQIETGQYELAIGNLSAALSQRPNDPDLLYYLGRASGLLSKRSIDTLVQAYPDSARTHQAMAENYLVLRQMPQAENELRAALQQRPDIPGLHLELGLVYAGAAQSAKAEEEFRTEAKLQPGNAEASYRLGSALLQDGKVHEAREELERADRLKPGMPETLYALGKAASLEGDTAGAEKAWLQLIDIEKQSTLAAQAHFGLAALYRKQGKMAKAQSELEEYRGLQKTLQPSGDRPN